MKVYTQQEVRVLLSDEKKELIDRFKSAVDEVFDCYPVSVFPEDCRTRDCVKAKVARETCQKVWEVFNKMHGSPSQEVEVRAVTMYEGGLIWGKFNGWKGKVIREAKNGSSPAYEVMISRDGVQYIKAIINKEDLV